MNIDDHDPSVVYTGTWHAGGHSPEYDNTVMWSVTPGDSFTVPFDGTSIAVMGTLDSTSHGVVTSYSIDGGTPARASSGVVGGDTFNQTFWASPQLSSGSHTLKVTLVSVNTVKSDPTEGTVWFDYFAVSNDPSSSSATISSESSTSVISTTHTAGKTSATSSKSASQTSSTPSNDNTKNATGSSNHVGAIAGGVIAVILILLAIVAFLLCYRKRKTKLGNSSEDSFEKFFNAPPHVGGAAQNASAPSTPNSSRPFFTPGVAAAAAGAGAGASHPGPGPGPGSMPYPQPGTYQPYQNQALNLSRPGYPGPNPGYGPTPPSSYSNLAASYGHTPRRPSEDGTSTTSHSTSLPPSMYAHNPDHNPDQIVGGMLTYNPTPIASSFTSPSSSVQGSQTSTTAPAPASKPDPDSIAELKKRQQEAVANYNAGLEQGGVRVVQHVDSGIRNGAVELPPVYSAA